MITLGLSFYYTFFYPCLDPDSSLHLVIPSMWHWLWSAVAQLRSYFQKPEKKEPMSPILDCAVWWAGELGEDDWDVWGFSVCEIDILTALLFVPAADKVLQFTYKMSPICHLSCKVAWLCRPSPQHWNLSFVSSVYKVLLGGEDLLEMVIYLVKNGVENWLVLKKQKNLEPNYLLCMYHKYV